MKRCFELTDETAVVYGVTVHRIRATEDIDERNVKKGDLGGFVQKKLNIRGRAWVYDDAVVMENAYVTDDVVVRGNACIYGNAVVCEHAIVCDHASVLGDACVSGFAVIAGGATVQGSAKLSGAVLLEDAARVSGYAVLEDHVRVRGDAVIGCNALVGGHASIIGHAVVTDCAVVRGRILIGGVTRVQGNVKIDIYPPGCAIRIFSDAVFNGDAVIHSLNDFIIMHNNWSSGRNFVWTRSNNMWSVGCFYGTGEELIKKAMQDSVASGRGYKRAVDYVESMLKDESTK